MSAFDLKIKLYYLLTFFVLFLIFPEQVAYTKEYVTASFKSGLTSRGLSLQSYIWFGSGTCFRIKFSITSAFR